SIEYFATAVPALIRIKDKYGTRVRFKIIGDKKYYCKEIETGGGPWVRSTEEKDLSEFDIGIMRLPDTEWARGKCGLKGLQYMALGIASLMSPVGVNKDIIQNGKNGYLPGTEDQWVECLSLLIENENLRRTIGEEGRRTVAERFSVHVWQEKYLSLFNLI